MMNQIKKTSKMIMFIVIISILLSGCKKNENVNIDQENINTETKSDTKETELHSDTNQETNEAIDESKTDLNGQDSVSDSPIWLKDTFQGEMYYSGYIGEVEVNMQFTVNSNNQVTGNYWYTKYNTPIPFSGYLEEQQLSLYTIAKKEHPQEWFQVLISEKLILKGIWGQGDSTYLCYLEQTNEDFSIIVEKPEMKPSDQISEFDKVWYGIHSTYFVNTKITMIPLYDKFIYFELFAMNGTHSGYVNGIAKYENNIISYETIDYSGETVSFAFTKKGSDRLTLESSNYQYGCGSGVSFEAEYNMDSSSVKMPDMVEGLTTEENMMLKELTGEYYIDYIQAGYGNDEYLELKDDFRGKVINIGLRGNVQAAIIVINLDRNTMMSLLPLYDEKAGETRYLYFSNDSEY